MMYQITQEMMLDLFETYIQKLSRLEKLKGLNEKKLAKVSEIEHKIEYVRSEILRHVKDGARLIAEIESKVDAQINSNEIKVYTDGAARGNNDPSVDNHSAIGFAVYVDDRLIHQEARYIGSQVQIPSVKGEGPQMTATATNNTSEYLAIIAALEYLVDNGYTLKKVRLMSDSNVVVQQVNLTNAARASHLIQLRNVVRYLIDQFEDIQVLHIPREENAYVDRLVNNVLDSNERTEINGSEKGSSQDVNGSGNRTAWATGNPACEDVRARISV